MEYEYTNKTKVKRTWYYRQISTSEWPTVMYESRVLREKHGLSWLDWVFYNKPIDIIIQSIPFDADGLVITLPFWGPKL